MEGANLGWWVPTLTLVVPPLLLVVLSLLSRLEAWVIQPDERAAKVARLLEHASGPEELEVEVSRLFADVADTRRRKPSGPRALRNAPGRRPVAARRQESQPKLPPGAATRRANPSPRVPAPGRSLGP